MKVLSLEIDKLYRSHFLIVAIIVAGVGLRLLAYCYNRSLWLDESMIVSAILTIPLLDILSPLEHSEVAPIGFLLITKVLTNIFGGSEYVLRIYPVVSSILSILVFYRILTKFSPKTLIPIALLLFVVSPSLISYSIEVKQYSSDVLFCLLLIMMALDIEKGDINRTKIISILLITTVALWSSHPSVFVISGLAIVLFFSSLKNRDWKSIRDFSLIGLVVTGNIIFIYTFQVDRIFEIPFYFDWWSSYFAPFPLSEEFEYRWYLNTFRNFVNFIGFKQITTLGLVGVVLFLGIVSLYERQRVVLFMLGSPIVMLIMASWLSIYPMGNRLMLFVVPCMIIFIAEGIMSIWYSVTGRFKILFPAVVTVILLGAPMSNSIGGLVHSPEDGVREVVEQLNAEWQEGDTLYIYYNAKPAFDYYFSSRQKEEISYVVGIKARGNWVRYKDDIDSIITNDRVWFFFSAVCCEEQRDFIQYLDEVGVQAVSIVGDDGAGFLYLFEKD